MKSRNLIQIKFVALMKSGRIRQRAFLNWVTCTSQNVRWFITLFQNLKKE